MGWRIWSITDSSVEFDEIGSLMRWCKIGNLIEWAFLTFSWHHRVSWGVMGFNALYLCSVSHPAFMPALQLASGPHPLLQMESERSSPCSMTVLSGDDFSRFTKGFLDVISTPEFLQLAKHECYRICWMTHQAPILRSCVRSRMTRPASNMNRHSLWRWFQYAHVGPWCSNV